MGTESSFAAPEAIGRPATAFGRRDTLRWAIAAFALVVVLIVDGMILFGVMRQRAETIQGAERMAESIALLLVEHTTQTIARADQVLQTVADALPLQLLEAKPGDPYTAEVLLRHLQAIPYASALLVVEQSGAVRHAAAMPQGQDVLASAPSAACDPGGDAPIERPTATTLHIVPPRLKNACQPRIALVRPLFALADGIPLAVAVVIPSRFFRAFYDSLAIGTAARLSLWHTDSILMAGTNNLAHRVGETVPNTFIDRSLRSGANAAITTLVSPLDGSARMVGIRTVSGLPLVNSVSLSMDEVLGPWRQRAAEAAVAGITLTLAILAMAAMLIRAAGRNAAAREALLLSEQRFRDFAAASSDWYWEQDENLRFTHLSASAPQHSGMSVEDHLGKTRRETKPLGPTDEEWDAHEALLRAHRPFKDFCLYRVQPDGATRHLAIAGVPVFDTDGTFRGYRGTGTDITTSVQAKEALQAVIDAVPAMINAKDLDSRYVLMNAYQATLYGATPAGAIGKTATDLLGGSYGAYTRGFDRQVVETGKPLDFYEERYACADGIERDWMTTKVPLFDSTGRAYRVITVSLDITNRKTVERRLGQARTDLQAAKDAAEAANSAKTNFLANMSHELRTPLNAILGFSEIMQHQMMGPIGSPRYVEFADGIHRSGAMLLKLINDVLDMAKIEAGRRELQRDWMSLADAADDALLVIRQRAEQAGVGLTVTVPPNLPPFFGDQRAISQILVNLLTNAVKFTPCGGDVALSIDHVDDRFTLTVADTGCGIPPELLDRIGTPFFQVEHSMTRSHEGTGLGLALTMSLINLHNGEMRIESTLNEGTTITVALPQSERRQSAA